MGGEAQASGDSPWSIRDFCVADVAGMTEILQESPEAANWSGENAGGLAASENALWLVCESQGSVAGFLMGRYVVDEAEIHNLGVRRSERRRGIGTALIEAAVAEFRKRGACRIYLEVRESNAAAIALYRVRGFVQQGIRKGYYRSPDEGAVLMDRTLESGTKFPQLSS